VVSAVLPEIPETPKNIPEIQKTIKNLLVLNFFQKFDA
jgi:hypothetical protein